MSTYDPETIREPRCPKCQGHMWDNRATKKNPKQPDFKCKDKQCDGVIWPPRESKGVPQPQVKPVSTTGYSAGPYIDAIDGPAAPTPNSSADRLDRLFKLYDTCFAHANKVAHDALGGDCTHAGIAAQAATLFIAAKEHVIAW